MRGNRWVFLAGALCMASCGQSEQSGRSEQSGGSEQSELTPNDFSERCFFNNRESHACAGKFIRWQGRIWSVENGKMRIGYEGKQGRTVGESESAFALAVDLAPNVSEDVSGRSVLFSGRITEDLEVEDAKIEKYLGSVSEGEAFANSNPLWGGRASREANAPLSDYQIRRIDRARQDCSYISDNFSKGFTLEDYGKCMRNNGITDSMMNKEYESSQ